MTEKKTPKIEFAPGAFDTFEGTQEELDELVAEIQSMFADKTTEELEAMARPMTEEDFDDLPDAVKERLMEFDPEDMTSNTNRRLQ